MKHLDNLTNSEEVAECAALVMETVPAVQRAIRAEMRRLRPADLSVLQFRALRFVYLHPGAALSDIAQHVGLTMATVSKMVDGLVERDMLRRQPSKLDRRRMMLTLTPGGQTLLQTTEQATGQHLATLLTPLSQAERQIVAQAMEILKPLFAVEADQTSRADEPTEEK